MAYAGKASTRTMLLVPLTFGLVHGLGFAAALTDKLAEWRHGQVVQVLIGFNLGVELAQMLVIFGVAGLLWTYTRLQSDDRPVRRALGAAVALIGFGVMVWRLWELLTGEA